MVMTGKIHRMIVDGVDVTPCDGDYTQQQIEDALATPGTARRLCVMSGTNMGKTVAAVQCGMSFGRATEAMAFFVDSEPIARAFNTMYVEPVNDCIVVGPKWEDSVADPIEDILRARDKIMQITQHPIALAIEDEIHKLQLSSIFGRMERYTRHTFYHPPVEPRPKRDRKNRGPAKHSEWWNKGRRW